MGGPIGKKLEKEAERLLEKGVLKIRPIFGFYSLPELQAIYRDAADLYIHCATVEVEGLGCTEAIRTGLVPIIAKGRLTATAQYALSENSKYPERNARTLAARIDYWLGDDARRRAESEKYRGIGDKYDISHSIDALIKFYRDAVAMP